jgi:hypothetical protein
MRLKCFLPTAKTGLRGTEVWMKQKQNVVHPRDYPPEAEAQSRRRGKKDKEKKKRTPLHHF